ncbi:MAG: ATP-binding cassette domain-containing protein [Sporolactobacillus sp.]
MIELSDVEKIYQTADGPVQALKNINLSIKEGEIFGIIGYSGAGKSTLIRLINLLEKPDRGQILLDGEAILNLADKSLRQRRKQISMIFQHFNLLWSRTVAANIALPLELSDEPKKKRQTRVAELIRLVGLEGREKAYPAQLSGGQKQRVGIARALANHPKVLLCDEATSALDPKTTDSILQLLTEINRKFNLTIVLITHEMSVIRRICDRVAVLDRGVIAESGTVAEVFSHPQQAITREFVAERQPVPSVPAEISGNPPEKAGSRLVKISYGRGVSQERLLRELYQNAALSIHILQASPGTGSQKDNESLVLRVVGSESAFKNAARQLSDKAVKIEVLDHA